MKVVIDLTPLHGRKWTGVELYAIDLYHALLELNYEVIPIFHMKNDLDDNPNSYIIKPTKRLLLENFALSKAIRTIKADVALFPIFPPPIDIYFCCKTKIMPTIHDLAFLKYRSTINFAAKYYLTPKTLWAFKQADELITISETVKKQLQNYTQLTIKNWGENISSDFRYENLSINVNCLNDFGLQPDKYYISVSTIEPRKNLTYLLDIIRGELMQGGKKLVLVGRSGWGKNARLQQQLAELKQHIIFTEYVSIETLQSLYHHAYAFVLMSLDEGFGRTPLEAIACGCKRIVVSDIEIFHEVLGGNVNYLPLNDIDFCKAAFKRNRWAETPITFKAPFDALKEKIDL